MMQDAINNFPKQFAWTPKIVNKDKFKKHKQFILLGMGGSHLAADLILAYDPAINLKIHSDYSLPKISEKELQKSLIIASSYSGNTEEVIDGLETALEKNLAVAVIAVGGKLLAIAKEKNLPYVQIPDTGIQPRAALGYSAQAILKLIGAREALKETKSLKKNLRPGDFEQAGRELAEKLNGRVPVIYAAARNRAVAMNWKIIFNETGKIPAFYNVAPELNHNEMTGFDVKGATKNLSEKFYFIFLRDSADEPRNLKRLEILQKLYQDRGLTVEIIELTGENFWQKAFRSLLLADWAAVYLAQGYGMDPEQVPMVEEFKREVRSMK
ncbi:MAG: SIS domain-containing protein [Patescibacteria group bacterium]